MLSRLPSSGCERPGSKDVLLVAGGGHPLSGAPPLELSRVLEGCLEVPRGLQGPLKNWETSGFWTF